MPSRSTIIAVAIATMLAVPAFAANRKVDIVNKTGKTLTSFHASTPDVNSWEEDILDEDTLADGESFEADIDDGTNACIYDFKGVFSDGTSLIKRKVNVCEVSTFTFLP